MNFANENNSINTDLTLVFCSYSFAQQSGMIYSRANEKMHKLGSAVEESIYHAYVTVGWYSSKINNHNINL